MDAGSTPAPGATEQIDRRLSFRGEPTRGNAASLPGAGQSASSPCPPPAFTEVERVVEWIRSEWPRGGDRVDYLVDLVKRLDPPGSAESDARALEHVGKLLQSECIKQTSPEALLRRASALRAAAPESEPDVFESFGLAADEDDSGRFEGREHRISADARNWFGDILRLAKQAQSDETMSESWRYAFALALSALRRRAQEASA